MVTKKEDAARAVAEQQDFRRARLDDLKVKLKARTGNPAHKENIKAIAAEIERIEAAIAAADAQ